MKPLQAIDEAKMSTVQWTVVIISVVGLIFDGFDYQATAFAAPLIRHEWQLAPKAIGFLISASFFGLFFGSIFAGYLADLVGRKKAIAACIFVFSSFTLLAAVAPNYGAFVALRFLTGIGLGGVMPIATAWVSEFFPARIRAVGTATVLGCFSLGWFLASGIAVVVIPTFGWRAFFMVGALPVLLALYLFFGGPESPMWLISKGRHTEAKKILNRIAPQVGEVWDFSSSGLAVKANWLKLFSRQWIRSTLIIGALFILISIVSAGVTQWLPTMLVSHGVAIRNSYLYSFVASSGPIAGAIVLGYLFDIAGRRLMLTLFWIASAIFITAFGFATSPIYVIFCGFFLMFFAVATFSGLDVCTVEHYPTDMRASAIGWGLGVGRLGGAFGPILGGYLVAYHISYTGFFVVFAVIPLINAVLITGLHLPKSRPHFIQTAETGELPQTVALSQAGRVGSAPS